MKSAFVFEVGEKDFEDKVLNKSKETPVVVDFWAPWCGPCRSLTPILERLVQQRNGEVRLAKVNIDEEQALAYRYNVQSIPLVVGFRDGKAAAEFLGLVSEREMIQFLDKLSPTKADRLTKKALELEKSNPIEAEKAFRQALKEDADQEAATLGLIRLLMEKGKDSEAAELFERLPEGGEHGDEKERLGAIVWLRRQAAERGDEATLRHRVEVDPKNAGARFDLGCRARRAGEIRGHAEVSSRSGGTGPQACDGESQGSDGQGVSRDRRAQPVGG
jgi:putative thioredoxin